MLYRAGGDRAGVRWAHALAPHPPCTRVQDDACHATQTQTSKQAMSFSTGLTYVSPLPTDEADATLRVYELQNGLEDARRTM